MPDEMKKKKRILIVEDEEMLLKLYSFLLKEAGYDVETQSTGSTAYEAIKNDFFDLVLLDIMIPEMDGIQVLTKLKDEGVLDEKKPNIVMMTNLGKDTYIGQAVSLGIRGYIVKSDITPDVFLNEVKRFVE
jgi:DNA-binding response OmpR family regulator